MCKCVVYVCMCVFNFQKFRKLQKFQKISKKFKKSKKSQKFQKISRTSKKFKKTQKFNNSKNLKFFEFLFFWIFFYYFVEKSSFSNNFLLFWNFPNLRKVHRVNPGEIEFLFFSRFFWHIKRIFSTSYAKVMAVSIFFFVFCKKKGQNAYSKFLYQLDTKT